MDTAPCVEAVEEPPARYGKPEIFNSDQGSQFTSHDFTKVLLERKIRISMDGKGAWRDNVFVERLWRTVKYEEVYLKAYDSVKKARASIGNYLEFSTGGAHIRALTAKRRMRPIATHKFWQRSRDRRQRFCRSSGRAEALPAPRQNRKTPR